MKVDSLVDKIKKRLMEIKAKELHQIRRIAFLHIKQLFHPTKRLNG